MSSVIDVVAVVYLLAALVAWWLRPFSRTDVITAVGGVMLFPGEWFATTNAPLAAMGTVVSEPRCRGEQFQGVGVVEASERLWC